MARNYGSTAERGYGREHQIERERRLAGWRPGDPCVRCGGPMWNRDEIDLGHTEDRTAYVGLEHRRCNRREGASRGNQQRGFLPVAGGSNVICKICYRPYHYAAKACEMCGGHYHPTYGQQRTCSRPCGVALRRAAGNLGAAGRARRQPRPICKTCGKPCLSLGSVYCSAACRGEASREQYQSWPSSRLQHYTCRYCGKPAVTKATSQPREVCPARACQLARLAANNLRTRNGLTQEEADAQVREVVIAGQAPPLTMRNGRWRSSRRW